MPFGSSQWMYSSGFYPTEIDQSLKFDGTSYLSRTPSVAGSLTTWTWSGWVKRGALGSDQTLFGLDYPPNDQNFHWVNFSSADKIDFGLYPTSVTARLTTTQVFRDPSAWYNIVAIWDTTNATADDRMKLYVNGVQITAFSARTNPTQNTSGFINTTNLHTIGDFNYNAGHVQFFNGYMADTYFVDGTALDPTSFGEFKNGVWIPKAYTGSYGTNGFHLTYQDDTVSEGFNTVTYTGNGQDNTKISGIGFSPDLVWIKTRSVGDNHVLNDSVRGGNRQLFSNATDQEFTSTTLLKTFDSDGFTLGTDSGVNGSGRTLAAWCWDAGDSTVSNTDGSITSSVRANPAYGFSIVSYTGTGAAATVGHGLGAAPEMVIVKVRSTTNNWPVYHVATGNGNYTLLNTTAASAPDGGGFWNGTTPSDSVVSLGSAGGVNASSATFIAYCFHSVAGYSKFGSYTGTGASGNVVTTGFKPAFVMVKRTDSAGNWVMFDATRNTQNTRSNAVSADLSDREYTSADGVIGIDFTDTGFTLQDNHYTRNASGGTYIYMAFADTRDLAFWRDQSGNGNDWQPTNLNYQDTVFDSPTNNYATLNPIWDDGFGVDADYVLSNGNLELFTSTERTGFSTFAISSGKWYWEITHTLGTSQVYGITDISTIDYSGTTFNQAGSYYFYPAVPRKYTNGSFSSYGSTFTTGDVAGVSLDLDGGTITIYKNGVSLGVMQSSLPSATYVAGFAGGNTNDSRSIVNFGQSGFTYTPPAGFLALSTANLPEPSISPLYGASPQDHFNTVLWTGDGNDDRSITGVGFQPDFTWIKRREAAASHLLHNSVIGANSYLKSDTSDLEATNADGLQLFESDGFQVGANSSWNGLTRTYVAWNWKASNATAVSNTAGSITSQVSANPTAGFSIVSYTGTGSAATVGHGLGVVPKMVIVKSRSGAYAWTVYNASVGATYRLRLNETAAAALSSEFNNTTPTSTVFSVDGTLTVNGSTETYVAYCFADVEGYSQFGSYTGNGSADGPFVYTGFRPAWVMIKRTDSTANWHIKDTERDPYNFMERYLNANDSAAEGSGVSSLYVDYLSNGFKLRGTSTTINPSGGTLIYMAFAENPFKYANAR